VPGRRRGDLDAPGQHYGGPLERGPDEVKDRPQRLVRDARPFDLTQCQTASFGEIVAEPQCDLDGVAATTRYASAVNVCPSSPERAI